jgi:hypothetical protein
MSAKGLLLLPGSRHRERVDWLSFRARTRVVVVPRAGATSATGMPEAVTSRRRRRGLMAPRPCPLAHLDQAIGFRSTRRSKIGERDPRRKGATERWRKGHNQNPRYP